ncbi:regulator of chromosome condensation 1/beta-lactamase-inhibitor protein II [Desarmillaria tabescens]|uniref:Regulator of chromosome condensation 1/beta-lactamase-inhibitor protein II n=1 Tax=Armillaria tabescens TaxID=1929756 RepID=A0AA39T5P0_ARMTA|nr:regulator of chromosome condensation 1/beta-lactamase-inhibitor protein II [Desarmillaria tabescens]KAK0466241.1 regulator of chromosome condensation 1/beta-lactamase-inhibitor protein II [Desarmillaria tabescens]
MPCLVSAGSNAHGQLANGTIDDSHAFATCIFNDLPPDCQIVDLCCGANHTLLLLENREGIHELWGCGDGRAGQLGPDWVEPGISFHPIMLNRDGYIPKMISASWETSYIVLTRLGQRDVLISMGADDFGDLGVGTSHSAAGTHTVELPCEGEIITALYAGQHHVVIQVDGTHLVGWGLSRHGQLGEPKSKVAIPRIIPIEGQIVSIALGAQHTALLLTSGHVIGLGSNRKEQLHGLEIISNVRMVGCTWNGTYAVVDDRICSTGSHSKGQLGRSLTGPYVEFPHNHHLKKLACGTEHVLVLFDVVEGEPEVWGWGWNEHGNLGLGTTEDIPRPVKLWPRDSVPSSGKAVDIWAGSGTSWIYVR